MTVMSPAQASAVRLLQVAQRFSANPTSGAELRIFHLANELARHMSVTHLGFAPPGTADVPARGGCPIEFAAVARQGSHRIIDLARGVVGRIPYPVLNYTRRSMKSALCRRLETESFDIVLLESIHLAAYLPLLRQARNRPRAIVCDWHNIESEVLSRYSDGGVRPFRRLYGRYSAQRLAAFERWFVGQCDLHIAVSERDRDTMIRQGARTPIVVIDNGVDVARFRETGPGGGPPRNRVLYVGSMDSFENSDAVTFFAAKAWPQIRRSLPGAVFTIVGRNPSREVQALASVDGIEVTGSVADVGPYYRQAIAAVVPLRVGGGTRLKILEAMAAGVPVVSTLRGAEGLLVTPGVHYLLANDQAGMHRAVVDLAGDPAKRERLAAAAGAVVRERYDWPVLGDRLAAALFALLEGRLPGNAAGE